jgi:hypothetical protein
VTAFQGSGECPDDYSDGDLKKCRVGSKNIRRHDDSGESRFGRRVETALCCGSDDDDLCDRKKDRLGKTARYKR